MKKEYRKTARKANGKIRELREGQVRREVPLTVGIVNPSSTRI